MFMWLLQEGAMTTKCPQCGKVYFDIGEDTCPFCKKEKQELPDCLKDIFRNFDEGEDNDRRKQ